MMRRVHHSVRPGAYPFECRPYETKGAADENFNQLGGNILQRVGLDHNTVTLPWEEDEAHEADGLCLQGGEGGAAGRSWLLCGLGRAGAAQTALA